MNAYTLVVAVALSAQSHRCRREPCHARSVRRSPDTPEKMLALGEEGVTQHIKDHRPVSQQGQESSSKLSRILVEQYGGEVPSLARGAANRCPVWAAKTANVVLNMWWRMPAQAVDTHIFRVRQTALAFAPAAMSMWSNARSKTIFPPEYQLHAHHWLILHGR